MRLVIAFSMLLGVLLSQQRTLKEQLQPRYSEAIRTYNAGRIAEARSLLEKLLAEHPNYYRGYRVLWDAVGRTEDAAARRTAAERDLKLFEAAPTTARDEEFYSNFISGYDVLGKKQRIAAVEAECIAKFPRGQMAQQKRLKAAEAAEQQDPVRSAELYAAYLKEFDENISWTAYAAHRRFWVVKSNLSSFDLRELASAVEENEYRSKQYIAKFGNPFRHLAEMEHIVEALVEADPASALNTAAALSHLFRSNGRRRRRSRNLTALPSGPS